MLVPGNFGFRLLPVQVVESSVTDNGEQPRSRIVSPDAIDRPKRLHEGLLHDILGVLLIADQPSGEVVRTSQVRPNSTFELLALIVQAHLDGRTHIVTDLFPGSHTGDQQAKAGPAFRLRFGSGIGTVHSGAAQFGWWFRSGQSPNSSWTDPDVRLRFGSGIGTVHSGAALPRLVV